LVKSLGATHVIDYTKEDFTAAEHRYDVVFDAVGKLAPSRARQAIVDGGEFLTVKTMTKERPVDLLHISELVQEGKVKPLVDRRFPLDSTADAHRYVETGHKKGNVIITIGAA
jgi:NADPH:quinone reductase-like Zn-dependent oxidoreductase